MKRTVVHVVLGGLAITGLGLGLFQNIPALSAELKGFAIHTQDKEKAVTVTLFTDQRVPYATEHQGKQFAIILPNTQISPEQLRNGLPVVVDNKNRFIGRAVPTEDGKVKIILPNLSAKDYAVSIQQKRRETASAVGQQAPRPRSIGNFSVNNTFEQAVANLPKVSTGNKGAARDTAEPDDAMRPSANPTRTTSVANTHNLMWNPYVVKTIPPQRTEEAEEDAPPPKLSPTASAGPDHIAALFGQSAATYTELPTQSMIPARLNAAPPAMPNDPLWYLHTLPPANGLTSDNLKALAAEDAKLTESIKTGAQKPGQAAAKTEPKQKSRIQGLIQEIKDSIHLPKWLVITLAVFLGGIGLFALVGGMVLLKILFTQNRPTVVVTHAANTALGTEGLAAGLTRAKSKSGLYATNPASKRINRQIADTSSISALDFLKKSPDSVAKAVHNTTLVKFQHQRNHRTSTQQRTGNRLKNERTYSVRP